MSNEDVPARAGLGFEDLQEQEEDQPRQEVENNPSRKSSGGRSHDG